MFDALVVALAAATQPTTQAAPVPQEGAPIVIEGQRPVKKICRESPPPTGTRLGGRRICRTEFEWRMIEESAQRTLDWHRTRERAMRAYEQNQKSGLADKVAP